MRWWGSSEYFAQKRRAEGLHSTGQDLERKFWPAMAVYAGLAALIWFTLDASTVHVLGKPLEIRLIPMLVIGLFVFRTWLAREADRLRRRSDQEDAGKLL